MLERKQLKDKLVVYISVILIILISCFGIISILTAGSSFSAGTEIVWDGVTVASSFSAGNGTEENPYLISNGEELAYFKQLIESDDNVTYADKYYALSANINLDNHEWIPIGNGSNIFKGVFDGAGYTISNIKILEGQVIEDVNYYGLFSIVEDASVVNLNVNNIVINPSSSEKIYKIGSLVGDVRTIVGTVEDTTLEDSVVEEDTTNTEVTYNSEISNVSIYNSLIDLSNTSSNDNNMIGGLSANIGSNVNLYNIYLGISITSDYVTGIGRISHTLQSNSNYIITNVTTNSILVDEAPNYVISDGVEVTNHFYKDSDGYVNDEEVVSSENLILIINENLDYKYTWVEEEGTLKISIIDFSSTDTPDVIKTFAFSPSATISLHDTGIEGSTIYINDLDSDLNYYKGLNYTDFSSTGTLPTGTPLTTYDNLAKVYIKYSGTSIADSSLTGYVSLSEQYSDFVYYKYYPVVNGYVTIELIDNPYADRPDDMVFNGWFTDYSGAEVWLDTDIYTRFVKIPVTDTTNPISITFYANWFGGGKTVEVTADGTDLDSSLAELDSAGFINYTQTPVYEDPPSTLYTVHTVDFSSNYPSGALSSSGQTLRNQCWTWGGCTYYLAADMSNFDPSGTYYEFVNRTMTLYVPEISGYEPNPDFAVGTSVFGLYKEVTVANGSSLAGYYDSSTSYYSSGTCSSSEGCTVYEEQGYVDDEGNELTYDGTTAYYYLATRDTNIVVLRTDVTATLTNSKPFTLTGIHNGQNYISAGSYNINGSYIYAGADLRIEWINLTADRNPSSSDSNIATSTGDSSYIYGNWYNLKIGRGITYDTTVTARGVLGGGNNSTGSSSSLTRYRLIIESGYYNVLSVTNGSVSSGWGSSVDDYIDGTAIYGNDLDRINSDNDNLVVYFSACGSWGGYIYSSDEQTGIAINTNVKSGSFGTSETDYSTGIYVGGRSGGTHYAARRAVIEGGWIYNLIGGPLTADDRSNINDTYINIKGGSVDYVIGGAGASATYGNRIINHTGGIVNYSIFGGSNGYTGSDNGNYKGTLEGSTFIYVGGTAVVGDDTLVANNSSVFGAEAGSVFGIGNGNSTSSYVGTADNSNIIIDGSATIKRNIYGGGNFGPVGAYASTTPKTDIRILNGTINGSVYGGGNNNGAGTSNVKAEINITMQNGTVLGSIYGGSKTKGTVYGNSIVSILGGKITTDVYGGGEGGYTDSNNPGTFVSDNVSVTIGDNVNTNDLTIGGSVYGGSAYGSVNGSSNSGSASSYTTAVTVNRGVITNSVFGGGKGSSDYTPKVYGNVIVNINGGNIGSVYGGNDAAGSPSGTDYVYLSGGVIGNAFGGGNNTGQTNTNIYLQGSTVTNLYGGSNSSGTVDVSNVIVTSGTVQGNIYGGNNVGGTTVDANVTVSGITSITGDIYGGGSLADSTSSEVVVGATTVNDVYGGGEQASVDTTKITINGATGGDLFGGSNVSGEVTTSDILINSGTFDNVYGGNNQGGTTATTNIEVKTGTIDNVYGGGNHAASTTSNVIIKSGDITNVFGGGNEAGLTTANVDVYGGTIDSVYGGSNAAGNITDANVYIDSIASSNDFVSVEVTSAPVVAEDWQSTTYDTYVPMTFKITNTSDVVIDDWEVNVNMPSDANIFSNYSGSDFTITDGIAVINAVNKYDANAPYSLDPGESYSIEFAILTNTSVSDFEATASIVKPKSSGVITGGIVINNVYGGNNLGGTTTNPIVDINAGDIGNVYGGGNKADVNSTKVYIDNALVDVVFGGGNAAKTSTDTLVDINNSIVNDSVYGGGNEGVVSGSTEVFLTNTSVAGSAYAGGNGSTAIVSVDTSITVDGTSVIGTSSSVAPAGSVFGGGKAAATGDATVNSSVATVNIVGATVYGNVYGGPNTSVVYGKTYTNIGTAAVNDSSLVEGDIIIYGTVFGGGEANASGSENYDYTHISVTDAIDIYIDGTGYIDNGHKFLMYGSIFGSGNASTTSGTSEVYIKNLGVRSAPSKNVSIQRANTVVLDNSVIELSGTTDSTNDYLNEKYSFNRIDSLTIKNNTVLLLQENANLLKEFNSMVDVDGEEVVATVTINDEDKTVTKNVDNRLYLEANKILNVATNQNATAYGRVTGMTFFGMYNSYDNGAFQYGVYSDSISYGSSTSANDIIIGGSYVKGLHHANHDITVDGFYTNYMSEDFTTVTTAYIEPTPPDAGHYMWAIGVQSIKYEFNLNASKYSSLGTYELSMPEFSSGDTTFYVIGFNSEGLSDGVGLIEPTSVPKIAETPEEANQTLGLAMKTETREWTSYATTKFYTDIDPPYGGDSSFKTDSQTVAPSLMFYLYHAKNITLNADIGTVVITLHAETPISDIESELQLITITVNITATEFDDGDYYDASITYDKKYEMPSATSVNITNQSQFTAYYSLFTYADSFEDFYGIDNSNYHALVTNRALPVGTQITMIDMADGSSNPEYYYYTVDTDSYNAALQQLEDYGEIAYRLSNFIRMGSVDADNTYDDTLMNQVYYSTEYDMVIEEFIFIFDFKETTVTGTHLANSMLLELRNKDDRNVVSVLSIRQNLMLYNTYDSSNVVLEETVTPDSNYLYYDIPATYALTTAIAYDQTESSESIINTNYESNSMGLNVEVLDSTGNQVSSSMLTGTNIMIDDSRYFADSDGVFRIKLAGKVSNINRNMYITTDKMLPSGTYTLRFTLFASPDGKHNSHLLESAYVDIPVTVVGSDNSIVVETVDETKVVHGETGLNELGLDYNEYTISSNSVLNDPNIRISVYKRSIASKDTTEYEEVPISNLFTNYFIDPSSKSYTASSSHEKLLNVTVGSKNTLSFSLADNLVSGTYRVVFKLYDKDQLIQEEIKYVIVRKNIE